MSLGRYNLTPYNYIPVAAVDMSESYRIYTTLTAVVVVNIELVVNYRCDAAFDGEMNLQFFHNERYEMDAELDAQTVAHPVYWWKPQAIETDLSARAVIPVQPRWSFETGVNLAAVPKLEVIYGGNLFALLSATIDSLLTEDEEMWFETLTIKAGDTLVIDSSIFSVTVDNKDVIDLYEGEWPTFDKKLDGVVVQSLSGGTVQTSVLYRERYL